MNVLKYVRNNPKKSVFGAIVCSYLGKWLNGLHNDHEFRHTICRTVKQQGLQNVNWHYSPKTITVFLNPAANHGKALKLFEKNCAPIFHLSGCNVKVIRLDYEGEAKMLMSVLDNTDVIVAAGGNGTVNEIITGLLRRPDFQSYSHIPIGIIPLGETNTIFRQLCCSDKENDRTAQRIMNATNDILQSKVKSVDVLKISGENGKNVFALSDLRWGSYSDAFSRTSKYWFWGPLKKYMTYVFASLKSRTQIPREFELQYTEPEFIEEVEDNGRTDVIKPVGDPVLLKIKQIFFWLIGSFVKESNSEEAKKNTVPTIPELNDIVFDNSVNYNTLELTASINSVAAFEENREAHAHLSVEKTDFSIPSFISNGVKRFSEARPVPILPTADLDATQFRIIPNNPEDSWFKIDNENFEAMSCTAQVIPSAIKLIACETQ